MGTHNATAPTLSRRESKIYNCLNVGGKWSATELTIKTYTSSPRNAIMEMRRKGIAILDEWRVSEEGSRYKVYFLP